MRKRELTLSLALGCIVLLACKHKGDDAAVKTVTDESGYTTPDHYDGMKLVWQDEFSGAVLNDADWNYETGGDGWGNHELEYYQKDNTSLKDGFLVIEARKESAGGKSYTSSRLTTQGKHQFQYGRIDIRAILPKGQGMWPALWMLGSSINTVNWPACGEIDIMEMIGGAGKDNTVHGTAHWDESGHAQDGGSNTLTSGILADKFHVYSIVWTASSIIWYIDDVAFHTTDLSVEARRELKGEFFLLVNVAVGGDWPGNPAASTAFPQQMKVDYIRVFQ